MNDLAAPINQELKALEIADFQSLAYLLANMPNQKIELEIDSKTNSVAFNAENNQLVFDMEFPNSRENATISLNPQNDPVVFGHKSTKSPSPTPKSQNQASSLVMARFGNKDAYITTSYEIKNLSQINSVVFRRLYDYAKECQQNSLKLST